MRGTLKRTTKAQRKEARENPYYGSDPEDSSVSESEEWIEEGDPNDDGIEVMDEVWICRGKNGIRRWKRLACPETLLSKCLACPREAVVQQPPQDA